jgi:hypothetical protein
MRESRSSTRFLPARGCFFASLTGHETPNQKIRWTGLDLDLRQQLGVAQILSADTPDGTKRVHASNQPGRDERPDFVQQIMIVEGTQYGCTPFDKQALNMHSTQLLQHGWYRYTPRGIRPYDVYADALLFEPFTSIAGQRNRKAVGLRFFRCRKDTAVQRDATVGVEHDAKWISDG